MKVIDWLLQGDPAIGRLTTKHLLEQKSPYTESGLIERYLALFDKDTGLWGNGVYNPKWNSTHYTLLELKYMEIAPSHEYYHRGLAHCIDNEWRRAPAERRLPRRDMCVLAMILSLCVYGKVVEPRVYEMVDYILEHQMDDGGWNCDWNSIRHPSRKSSLHTTLTVLEALAEYIACGYTHQAAQIMSVIPQGEEFLLKKKLFRSVNTGEVIKKDFIEFHYPTRWKYDAFKALEYFQTVGGPYDERMEEALELIVTKMKRGYITKGHRYSGKLHFPLETTKAGRFNTLRALKILKFYLPAYYHEITAQEFPSTHF